MNHNIFWPVYKNLEREFTELMYQIHIDDDQLDVYSSKITDLILRAATEIETVSKLLYFRYNEGQDEQIHFDHVALKDLNSRFSLDQKVVIISSTNCYLSNRTLYPFKMEKYKKVKLGKEKVKENYPWNEVYQALKHHRGENIRLGSIRNLFEIMAALFVLNLYFSDITHDLGQSMVWKNYSGDIGSDIFTVVVHELHSVPGDGTFSKSEKYAECLCLIKPSDDFLEMMIRDFAMIESQVKQTYADLSTRHGMQNLVSHMPQFSSMEEYVTDRVKVEIKKRKSAKMVELMKNGRFVALMNKHQF